MKLALLGDIAFFGKYSGENIDFDSCFGEIKKLLSDCDYVIGNLETPLTEAKKTVGGKSAYIKGEPSDVQILKKLGVTHVSLANNHMYDYREQGLRDTIQALDGAGIKWFGAYGKTEEITDDTAKINLRGYCCYSANGKGMSGEGKGIDELNAYTMEKHLTADKKAGVVTIASCHWGQEHVHFPNYDHVRLARKLSPYNTTVFYGHHPHVIQGIEKVNDSLIAYSLGNFCFDDVYTSKSKEPLVKLSADNKESFVLIIEIKDNIIAKYNAIPFSFEGGRHRIDQSVASKIHAWSEFLGTEEAEYKARRSKDLNAYINNRKKKRDLNWYLGRMNIESAKMILASRKNIGKYKSLVVSYIEKD